MSSEPFLPATNRLTAEQVFDLIVDAAMGSDAAFDAALRTASGTYGSRWRPSGGNATDVLFMTGSKRRVEDIEVMLGHVVPCLVRDS